MPAVRAADLIVYYVERGSGAPVVWVHGNWATCSWWEPMLARLPAGWRGLAYDLRGRGKTQGPDSNFAVEDLAGDLRSFLDALRIDAAHLVGHSLGGGVAAQFALDHPSRVRSLALIAPAWVDGMPADTLAEQRQVALKADRNLFASALKAIAPTVADDAYWRRLVAEGHEQRLAAAVGAVRALAGWKPGDRLRALACPKRVVGGELDPLIPPPAVNRAAEALGTRAVILPGVGHSPNIEAPGCLDDWWRALAAESGSHR